MADFYALQIERSRYPAGFTFPPDQNARYELGIRTELFLSLDWDSFIIHASILMDRLGQLAITLLSDQNVASRSFSDQKKWFRRPENNPYPRNEKYAYLVREKTDWYSAKLKPARDGMVLHAYRSPGGMLMSPTRRRIRVLRQRYVTEFNMKKKHAQLISLKQKYEYDSPEMQSTSDFWELADFFMTHDVRLDASDVEMISEIISTVGGFLPEVDTLVKQIFNFLEEFRDAFTVSSF